ncbi:MAG: hypothetical protein ACYCZX_19310 [Rhodospirillaceae bacterium]
MAAGLVASALAARPGLAATPWREFSYPEDGFAITGPAVAPRVVEKGAGALETHAYTFKSGTIGAAFLVKVTRNTATKGDNEQKLRDITSHNPKVMKSVTQAGMQGVQFGFEDTDSSSIGRIFATDRMIYTILAQGPVGEYPPLALNRWLDSFRLLDPRTGK